VPPKLAPLFSIPPTKPRRLRRNRRANHFRNYRARLHNVIFVGGVGLGKTHLATALGYEACQKGHSVLFAAAVDIVNTLLAAQTAQRLKPELKRFTAPDLLIVDELGYLPIDKHGADLLFQVISARYERGSMVITTNRPFKQWPSIFNNDATLTSAVLDRILHHNDTVVIEGPSYRMREKQND
jgi:DNA replication protein DnaC